MEKQNRKRKLPAIVRWILWVLLVQFFLFNLSAALYAYRFTHVYDDPALRNKPPNRNIFVKTWRLFSGPRQPRSAITEFPVFQYQTIKLPVGNMIFIDTWYARTDSNAKGTVILFHGIMGNKGMLIPEASEFLSYGYNVMLVDFRAHGNSGGNTTTIGVRESKEVKEAYDYIVKEGEKNILLYGVSMGAVVVSKAIADYDLKPSGVFLDMPFASLQSHLRARARGLGFSGFGEKPFGFLVTLWIGIERGFNGFKDQTARYVAKIKCPVLMQWGAVDHYVLKSETDKIYNAIASSNKKLLIYDHAGHESFLQKDPVKWQIEVEKFLSDTNK
ncbi:MAG TPA: alpha/beta fold hydrolase [Chitinophagaceae bacterium]|nr:alpha/beta fold hydrolase [Chitinophagaceae bacterium]